MNNEKMEQKLEEKEINLEVSEEEMQKVEMETEEQISEIDRVLSDELEKLRREKEYMAAQAKESISNYFMASAEDGIRESIIDILIEAGLTTREKFQEKTKVYSIKQALILLKHINEECQGISTKIDNIKAAKKEEELTAIDKQELMQFKQQYKVCEITLKELENVIIDLREKETKIFEIAESELQ